MLTKNWRIYRIYTYIYIHPFPPKKKHVKNIENIHIVPQISEDPVVAPTSIKWKDPADPARLRTCCGPCGGDALLPAGEKGQDWTLNVV